MKKALRSIAVVLLLIGTVILFYPHIQQKINEDKMNSVIAAFEEKKQEYRKISDIKKLPEKQNTFNDVPYLEELYLAMQEYNQNIYINNQVNLKDQFSYEQSAFLLSEYGVDSDITGYIEIPSIDIALPIYLGATHENMKLGAVQLCETSMPIGGENTNCVLAAHRGYSTAAMFRDIEKIQLKDNVYITNFWETLIYQVVEIKIISPEDVSEILIQPGKDMLTLSTCHPYRYNYQRYIVYCERVDTHAQN